MPAARNPLDALQLVLDGCRPAPGRPALSHEKIAEIAQAALLKTTRAAALKERCIARRAERRLNGDPDWMPLEGRW